MTPAVTAFCKQNYVHRAQYIDPGCCFLLACNRLGVTWGKGNNTQEKGEEQTSFVCFSLARMPIIKCFPTM